MAHTSYTLQHDPQLVALIKPVKQYSPEHKLLAQWAIECIKRYLPVFKEKYPEETIPETAIATLEKWIHDEIKMWDARKYTYVVLELARKLEQTDVAYSKFVRATSHCLATCHVPTHSEGAAMYILAFLHEINKDIVTVNAVLEKEHEWQYKRLKELLT